MWQVIVLILYKAPFSVALSMAFASSRMPGHLVHLRVYKSSLLYH